MSSFSDKIDKYFSSKYVNTRGRRYLYENNISNTQELRKYLEKKTYEFENKINKGNTDGFGYKTLHDLSNFLKYCDDNESSVLQNNLELERNDSDIIDNEKSNSNLKKFTDDILFSKHVDKYFYTKNVTIRSKNLLKEFSIKNLNNLKEFLNNNKTPINLKGYGSKSISDLETLYQYLIIKYFDSKIEDEPYEINLFNQEGINEELKEEFIHEDLFKTYVDQFFKNENVTIRSKKAIEALNIKNLVDLSNILKNSYKVFLLRGYGTKTISDLDNLYQFILKKETESNVDNVNNERVLFYNILKFYNIDEETLLLSSQKKLNIFNFIYKYFDDIFSELSKSMMIVLKYNLGFELLDSEKRKIDGLTNERIRQLNYRFYENKFTLFKDKINKLINFSDQEILFDKSFIKFNDELLKYQKDDNFNYKFYLFIYFILNDDYEFNNLNIFEKSNKLFEINEIIFHKKKYKFKNIFDILSDSIDELLNKKYYTEIIIIQNIETEKYYDEINDLINQILIFNKIDDIIFFENGVIKNNKIPDLETLIEMAIKYYNDLSTVEMIQTYIKEKYNGAIVNEVKIRWTILHNKDRFFNLGKTGKYGLVSENYSQGSDEKSHGFKSMRILITELLFSESKPLHLQSILKKLYSKYNTLNLVSLERIIRDTYDFLSIGQSFFILRNSSIEYELPINHRKIVSILLKLDNNNDISVNWSKVDLVKDFLKKYKVPDYQIDHILLSDLFVYNNKVTRCFEKYIIDDIIDILEDVNIENVLKNVYLKSSMSDKIKLRTNLKKYIQSEFHITILEEDIQKVINFHI